MPHRTFNLEQLTTYLHLHPGDVQRLMRETDIPYTVRAGQPVFRRIDIDAWASQRILGLGTKRLDAYHEKSARGVRHALPRPALIPELLAPAQIDLELPSKTRASVMRDMVALGERTERVLHPRELLASIEEREAMCSTAIPGGLALLHARHHSDYFFDGSFVVLGRTIQSIPFGAPDGRGTRLFFLICCADDRIHLHTLARLCVLAQKTDMLSQLHEAPDRHSAFDALVAAERDVLPAE